MVGGMEKKGAEDGMLKKAVGAGGRRLQIKDSVQRAAVL